MTMAGRIPGRARCLAVGGPLLALIGAAAMLAILSACAASLASLEKQAETGDPQAQVALGLAYLRGEGASRDERRAVELLRAAANRGHAVGQIALGALYADGQGVPKDARTAVEWYRKAAEQGSAHGQYLLGVKYYEGEGVSKDPDRALQLFRRAEKGYRAQLDGDGGDISRLERARAEYGIAQAEYSLGLMHYLGEAVPKDDRLAFEWYGKAANRGHAEAQYNLASMYLNGEGTSKDDVRAYIWFRLSALQGFERAEHNRELLRKSMSFHDHSKAELESRLIQMRMPRLGLPR